MLSKKFLSPVLYEGDLPGDSPGGPLRGKTGQFGPEHPTMRSPQSVHRLPKSAYNPVNGTAEGCVNRCF